VIRQTRQTIVKNTGIDFSAMIRMQI